MSKVRYLAVTLLLIILVLLLRELRKIVIWLIQKKIIISFH